MDLQNFSNEARGSVECRAAGAHEYPAAARLRAEMALEMGSDFDAQSADWRSRFCAYFSGKQAAASAQLFLACDGDTVVGCAIVSLLEHYRRYVFGTQSGYVNAVYVQPAYRRRGIATRLMELAIAWSREHDCLSLRLRASEDGRPLYEGLGFHAGREMELPL